MDRREISTHITDIYLANLSVVSILLQPHEEAPHIRLVGAQGFFRRRPLDAEAIKECGECSKPVHSQQSVLLSNRIRKNGTHTE